jgi:hypothetical protein
VINKHDIEKHWDLAINFKPYAGEIIVYDRDDNVIVDEKTGEYGKYSYERFKIGDGKTLVKDLPFADENKSQVQIITWEADD